MTLTAAALLAAGAILCSFTIPGGAQEKKAETNPAPLPSPGWGKALPLGPDARVKITEAYAKHVGSDAYFWSWPMVNMYNRRLAFSRMKEQRYVGPLMEAPLTGSSC
jgi:hypothetical protein